MGDLMNDTNDLNDVLNDEVDNLLEVINQAIIQSNADIDSYEVMDVINNDRESHIERIQRTRRDFTLEELYRIYSEVALEVIEHFYD